ncbi:MAG TPA: signal peptidase II [Patescibacteria group bacterium]|nr:signal peptidase II [Patescibacteria group bacterium]
MIPVFILTVLFLDQLTKFLADKTLALHQSIPIIRGVFHCTLVHNRGAAFGVLKNQTAVFIAAAVVAIFLIYTHLRRQVSQGFFMYRVSLCLILAGALGNLIDRIRYGYVVDFLDFRIWPVFNIADSAITIGAIILGYSILLRKEPPRACIL